MFTNYLVVSATALLGFRIETKKKKFQSIQASQAIIHINSSLSGCLDLISAQESVPATL